MLYRLNEAKTSTLAKRLRKRQRLEKKKFARSVVFVWGTRSVK